MSAGHFNTLDFKFCPKCGERLSYTSYEGYCAYTNCLWNNDDSADSVDEAPESTPATPAASSAGLVAHAKGAQECPRRYWVDVTSRHGAYSVSCQSEFEATRVRRHLACIRGIRASVCSAPVEVAA